MTSISKLCEAAAKDKGGFSGARTDQYGVYVAVGRAAASRGHEGQIVVGVEWLRPEAFGDDDEAGNFLMRPKAGCTRVNKLIVTSDIASVLATIKASVPAIVAQAIES
jgi:hypothetical protein